MPLTNEISMAIHCVSYFGLPEIIEEFDLTIDDLREYEKYESRYLMAMVDLDGCKYLHEVMGFTLEDVRADNTDEPLALALLRDIRIADWMYETYYKPTNTIPDLKNFIFLIIDRDETLQNRCLIAMQWLHEHYDLTVNNLHMSLFVYADITQKAFLWQWLYETFDLTPSKIEYTPALFDNLISDRMLKFFKNK